MKRFRKRPSPAMIVAMTALFISLVGTAFAGPIAEISLNKGEKKQIRKISNRIANKKITKRAPGLTVAAAQNANVANVAALANTVLDDAITSGKIKDAEVTTEDLANAAATLAKLADNSVDSSKVVDNSLAAADLGPNSVGSSEIASSAVGETEVGSNAIDSDEIRDGGLFDVDVGVASGTFALNAPSVAANACTLQTPTVAGVDDNDHVIVSPPFEIMQLDLSVTAGRAASDGFIRLAFCNPTGAPIDPPNATYNFLTINQ